MDARVELRRRLLRIDDSVIGRNNVVVPPPLSIVDGVAAITSATSQLRTNGHPRGAGVLRHKRLPRAKRVGVLDMRDGSCPGNGDNDSDGSDADEREGNNDDEGDYDDDVDDDDESEGSTTSCSNNNNSTPATTALPHRSDKCETSPVVKLLFSRHDATRQPTVCFDYPPHLNATRMYAATQRVITLPTQDCRVYYTTHWERNCVKNAFAVAGVARTTSKKWSAWHIAWAKHIAKSKFQRFHQLTSSSSNNRHTQVFNHVPDPWVIGRKDRLMRTLAAARRRCSASYNFFPEGFHLPDQMDAFRRALQREVAASSSSAPSIWILKPPASACGRGIRVITSNDVDAIAKDRKYVVQRYIANPLLVDGVKFDLRVYVVVTSVDPLRIYVYDDGLARFCTHKYSLSTLANRFSHLTNYSVNKSSDAFVENNDSCSNNPHPKSKKSTNSKWSLTELIAHLQQTDVLTDPPTLLAQIHAIICKTLIAAEAHLTPLVHECVKPSTHNVHCFELFGFDILLDSTLTPWLIEVNVSPSLMGSSPLDQRIKGMLLSDMLHLVGVPVDVSLADVVERAVVDSTRQSSGDEDARQLSVLDSAQTEDVDARYSDFVGSAAADLASSQQQQQQQQRVSTPPAMLHSRRRRSSSSRVKPQRPRSSPSIASGSSNTGTATTARTAAVTRRQLHDVVLDAAVPVFTQSHLLLFQPSDWRLIYDMEDELDRIGHFRRIFPPTGSSGTTATTTDSVDEYAPLFTCQRYANALCAKWLRTQQQKQKPKQQTTSDNNSNTTATRRLASFAKQQRPPQPPSMQQQQQQAIQRRQTTSIAAKQ